MSIYLLVDEDGEVSRLHAPNDEALKELPEAPLELVQEGTHIVIKCDKAAYIAQVTLEESDDDPDADPDIQLGWEEIL